MLASNFSNASTHYDPYATYNNHTDAEVYATDIFGIHMAWVRADWTFATQDNGQFMTNSNTMLVTNSGGVWPDGGDITGVCSFETTTCLHSSTDYNLHSALGQHETGTLVNKMVYNGNGNYQYYIFIYGTSYYRCGGAALPIDLSFSFDD